jgi:hypothetical protein
MDGRSLVGEPPWLDGYGTVFLGYPIWWGEVPMAVRTFVEACSWSGKTVAPFCTHAGSGISGISGTDASLASACAGASVTDALALLGTTAQNDRSSTEGPSPPGLMPWESPSMVAWPLR